MTNIILIDHHDSFTYNIVELFRQQQNCKITVKKPEKLKLLELKRYEGVVLSPGAGLPSNQTNMNKIISFTIEHGIPIIGICLGFQGLFEYFGGKIKHAKNISHGKNSYITTSKKGIYSNLPKQIQVGRYHSWIADANNVPESLTINSQTNDGIIMSFTHNTLNINGIQYHPESVLTPQGSEIISNWLKYYVNKE